MAHDIVMPNAGFDAQTVRLLEWLKQPGETVQKGEIIAVIESDKANVELESIASGVVLELLCQPDEEVAVGAVIARIGTQADYQAQSTPKGGTVSPVAARMAQAHTIDPQTINGSGPRGRVMRDDVKQHLGQQTAEPVPIQALPKVRKAIREAGLTLAQVYAQTQRTPIQMADVIALTAQPQFNLAPAPSVPVEPAPIPAESSAAAPSTTAPIPSGAREIPMTRMRQAIARQLSESMRQAPHFYVSGEFDVEDVLQRLKTLPSPAPKINDALQYLVVQTLRQVPELNATYQDGRLLQHDGIHLAIAVALDDGLITPVVRDAQHYSLEGLAAQSRALIQRARTQHLQSGDLNGGTFTISNMGVVSQVERFTAVINPPQVAILAVGSVKPRPVVRDGGLFVRHTVYCTLSGDHRVVDGMDLARFMAAFQHEIDRFVHS